MVLVYCVGGQVVLADESKAIVSIVDGSARVSESSLQPGDTFSITFEVQASGEGGFISDATATGTGISSKNSSFSVISGSEAITNTKEIREVRVSGLVYNGGDKQVNVTVYAGEQLGSRDGWSDSVTITLNAKTSEEFADTLSIEKQGNLVVKTDATQSVKVKITNKGSFTINQADAVLALDNKVDGLTIKNNTATVKNIKSKETKSVSFSIKADEDTKAGVYPATIMLLGNSFPVNIQVDSNIVPSALEVGVTGNSTFIPGVEKQATFVVNNVGDRDAKNIRLELVNTEHVSVTENSNVKRINLVSAKSSQNVTMKVRISSNFKGESVALPIKITYLSSNGEQAEDQQYVYLYTNSSQAAAEVMIGNVVSPTGRFDVDQNFTIKFNVSAKHETKNIQITAEGDEGIVPKSQNLFFINKLEPGAVKQYAVTFAATREAVTSSHPIKISVTYGQGDDAITINQYGSANIVNSKKDEKEAKEDEKDEVIKNKPKVIIGEYKITPTIVEAGANFEIELTFLNTSKLHSVHNLKANILPVEQEDTSSNPNNSDKGNVFTPVEGSNTIYIADLGTGESYTKVLTMYTIPSASAKTYQITVEMAYEDEKGNEMTASESLGIPVGQVTKVEVGDIYTDMGTVGMPIPFSVNFYNRGRTNISNMMVYIEGEGFSVEENKYFVGNFEIGASDSYDTTLTAMEPGKLNGTLVIEYEDPNGQVQELREPFEFEVEEDMMDEGMMPDEMMDAEEPSFIKAHLKMILIIGGIVLVVVIVLIIMIIKKRKAKRKARLLADEDEED